MPSRCRGGTAPGTATIVGTFARDHGALVPDRLITSAKSWLSNPHIDPRQQVLPWKSEIDEAKLSAFDCSRRYLEHLKEGFLHAERAESRDWDLAEGHIVLTVPASFDEVARSLTAEAAEAAGLGQVTLLEEPQAAFYAWTAQAGSGWREAVGPGDIVLVCDVGGGTADFSLIAVTESGGELALERISVGEHILLGGDNMDLALAYTLRAKLEAEGKSVELVAVPRAGPRRLQRQGRAVQRRVVERGADLGAVTGLQPVRRNGGDQPRSRHPRRPGARRLLPDDR